MNPEVPDEQRHLTAVVDAMNRSMVQRLAHEHAARLAQGHEVHRTTEIVRLTA